MNKRMIVMLVATAAVIVLVVGGRLVSDFMMAQWMEQMGERVTTVSAVEAQPMQWDRFIPAVGSARAIQGTQLSTEAAGKVAEILFSSGDTVEEGAALVRLDSGVDRAELKSLQAAAELARLELERSQRLREQGSISQAELDRSRSEADQAAARVEAQAERVALKTLRAPFDGQLGIRQVDRGQYLQPGTPVVNLQQLVPIHVEFSLPEHRMAQLERGYAVEARMDAWPDQVFEGEINAIEPGVRESSRNFRVQALFPNEEQRIRPGMFVRSRVRLPGETEVLAIPQTAVSFNPYGNSVWLIEEEEGEDGETRKTAQRRLIHTGERRGDYIAVTEGLEAGERIASSGLLKLSAGMRVEIDNEGRPEFEIDPRPGNH